MAKETKTRDMEKDLLQSNFSTKELQEIRHDFTNEEIINMKNEFFQVSSQLSERQELLKKVKDFLNLEGENAANRIMEAVESSKLQIGDQGMKAMTMLYNTLRIKIKKGYEIVEKMVYCMDYSDEGRLEFFDENGKFLYERKLAGRHQMHILSNAVKTATDNE
jgi:hypothetical protein